MRNQRQHPMDDSALFPSSAAEQICTTTGTNGAIQTKPSANKGFGTNG
jgi:hypothetical protein